MKCVLAIILGGGAGTRLYPLTKMRAKPAVPLAGKYRLIDIPISNCINSEINKIYVLTQFNSASLNRHLTMTYNLSAGFGVGMVFKSLGVRYSYLGESSRVRSMEERLRQLEAQVAALLA
jgi:ADP-glucose pyrophosphorylase